MTNCIKKSYLMKDWPVETITLPIDINKWFPIEKKISRKEFKFSNNSKLIIFWSSRWKRDVRKGFKLLEIALKILKKLNRKDDINVIIFGGKNQILIQK